MKKILLGILATTMASTVLAGSAHVSDKVEWVSKNEHVKWYRVTYELHGETFTLREMHRPLGNKTRMTVSVTPYR